MAYAAAYFIKRCWHSGLVGGLADQDMEDATRARSNEEGEVEQVTERLVAPSERMSVQNFLNVDNGDFSEHSLYMAWWIMWFRSSDSVLGKSLRTETDVLTLSRYHLQESKNVHCHLLRVSLRHRSPQILRFLATSVN